MDIVAASQRFLPFRANVAAEMPLVGRLVGREARVAVEAIDAVLHLQMGDFVVELGDAIDGLRDAVVETLAASVVLSLVLEKPRSVVVRGDVAQLV